LCVLGLALVAVSAFVSPALAGRSLVVGVNEDAVKSRPGISSTANDLGLGYYRVTQRWEAGRSQPSAATPLRSPPRCGMPARRRFS